MNNSYRSFHTNFAQSIKNFYATNKRTSRKQQTLYNKSKMLAISERVGTINESLVNDNRKHAIIFPPSITNNSLTEIERLLTLYN